MTEEFHIRIRRPEKRLAAQLRQIAESPAGDTPEAKEQIATLARAVEAVAVHCADLDSAFEALARSVEFRPQQ
jgi:hypothetical protein